MNKHRIRWIIALMTVSLIGIICLQVYWISHDIQLKEKQFEQTVNQAMNDIIDRIETHETFSIMNKSGALGVNFDPKNITNVLIKDSGMVPQVSITDTEIVIPEYSGETNTLLDNLDNADVNIEFHRPGSNQTIFRIQHRNFFHKDSTSTHHIRSSQLMRIYKDSAEVVIRRNEEKIKARAEKVQQVMEEWVREAVGNEGDVKKRLSDCKLDKIISNELQNRGIGQKFEFGVFTGDSKQLIMGSQKANIDNLYSSKFKTQLFPNDIFAKPEYLVLRFPDGVSRTLSSIWLMLASSSVFTLIILFIFAYTIQVIIRQKKLSDIKSDFINNMTHEFKTPIATISLAVDTLKNPRIHSDREKMDYFTRIIGEENKRMNAQVEHVLQMAQIEKGELTLHKEELNIHEVIEHAVEIIKIQVESREGTIEMMMNSTRPVISGDQLHLSNVIFNLLDNANKYSPGKPVITISTEDHRDGVLIKVKDQGTGMTKDAQKKIFEKFYRVPTGNLHDVKGFGLGLSYVKAIVDQHGGRITVDSDLGKGSTFEVFIPHS
jgi:signal transduction histidine kinase